MNNIMEMKFIIFATLQGLRIQVHKYREALLGAQVEKKHIESQLQSQLSFAQDCFSAEQVSVLQWKRLVLAKF